MTRQLVWAPTAERELRRLDVQSQRRVMAALERLAAEGQGDLARLQGIQPPQYRLRVGDWRVRLELDDSVAAIFVLHVRHRSSAYR